MVVKEARGLVTVTQGTGKLLKHQPSGERQAGISREFLESQPS